MSRKPLLALVAGGLATVLLATASPAAAAWLAHGAGSAAARATVLGAPTSPSAAATGSTSTRIQWSPPAAPRPAPDTYVVTRTSPAAAQAVACTVPASSPLICDDGGLAPATTYGYRVEARLGAGWRSPLTAQATVTTDPAAPITPSFRVEPVLPGAKAAGTAFGVRLTALAGAATDTAYTGSHVVAFSGPGLSPSGTAPTYPASVSFTGGTGTANVTLTKAEAATLAATEGARTGSTPVAVDAGAATALRYTGSSPSCATGSVAVGNGGTFTSKVSRFDALGNPANGATTTAVNVTRSGSSGGTGPTPSLLSIGPEASESGQTSLTIPTGNPTITMTASSGSLTSAVCTVRK